MVDSQVWRQLRNSLANRVVQGHLGIAQREEARQGIGIQLGKFIRGNPAQEGFSFFRMGGGSIHADGDISVIADVAGIASILNIGREDAKVKGGILFELADFP